jgi:hypothetical protein
MKLVRKASVTLRRDRLIGTGPRLGQEQESRCHVFREPTRVGDHKRSIREPRKTRIATWRKRKVTNGLLLYLVRTARGHEEQQAHRDPSRPTHAIQAGLASTTSKAPGRHRTASNVATKGFTPSVSETTS